MEHCDYILQLIEPETGDMWTFILITTFDEGIHWWSYCVEKEQFTVVEMKGADHGLPTQF